MLLSICSPCLKEVVLSSSWGCPTGKMSQSSYQTYLVPEGSETVFDDTMVVRSLGSWGMDAWHQGIQG